MERETDSDAEDGASDDDEGTKVDVLEVEVLTLDDTRLAEDEALKLERILLDREITVEVEMLEDAKDSFVLRVEL